MLITPAMTSQEATRMKNIRHLYTITASADRSGIPRSTIRSAITRGEIKVTDTTTGDGLRLIDERRLDAWWNKYGETERRGQSNRK